jgi:hypothetical protein
MSPELEQLAGALYDRACYEAASAGHAGEDVLTSAASKSIAAIRGINHVQLKILRAVLAGDDSLIDTIPGAPV